MNICSNDDIPVRATALVSLAEKFKAFEALEKEAYPSQPDASTCDEPSSFGSSSPSYSTLNIHDPDSSVMSVEEPTCTLITTHPILIHHDELKSADDSEKYIGPRVASEVRLTVSTLGPG